MSVFEAVQKDFQMRRNVIHVRRTLGTKLEKRNGFLALISSIEQLKTDHYKKRYAVDPDPQRI